MAIKVFIAKQTAEGVEGTGFIDMKATDHNITEEVSMITSEAFQSRQAEGDSEVGKIEVSGGNPVELTEKLFELLMPGLSYSGNSKVYKMSDAKPAFYTIVKSDTENNEKIKYIDCAVQSLGLKVAMGGYITAQIDVVGKKAVHSEGALSETGTDAGPILRALNSVIKLDGTEITEDVEGLDITIDNGLEAKGAINSLYNVKIRRTNPQKTTISVEKNLYSKTDFNKFRDKMLAGTPATVELTIGDGTRTTKIEILKGKLSKNQRGEHKGAGTHSMELNCSVENADNSHLRITFPITTLKAEF